MKEALFISGEPLTVDAVIQLEPYHIGLILVFPVPLRLKLFYNGEQLPFNASGRIKHPSEVSSSFIRPTEGLGVPVTFKLPRPTPEDKGLYEMQLFIDFDASLLNLTNCTDYIEFLQTPDGLELYEILIGSLTLMVHEQGQQGILLIHLDASLPNYIVDHTFALICLEI